VAFFFIIQRFFNTSQQNTASNFSFSVKYKLKKENSLKIQDQNRKKTSWANSGFMRTSVVLLSNRIQKKILV